MESKFSIIKTKLIAPVPRKNCIERTNLINELNNICDFRVTVIKGAAASGKSTLISSFVQKLNNVKWINLDEDNNNIYSFWYYFIEAVSKYFIEDAEDIINAIGNMINKEEIYNVIVYLINKMPNEDIYIVFDDYHNITEEFLNSSVDYLIKYSPTNIHYIFLSREEFPIYLGELRARGEILEIGENELKFSKDECTNFVKNTLKLDISDDVISKIFHMSEGWIGGIQFASLALKNKKDISDKNINIFNKYFIEYLTQEILNSLEENEREFIIKTSILNYFNAEICNYILEKSGLQRIIESLIDKNLFIIAVNENEHIYRYHHLFREFLNMNFEKLPEAEKSKVYIRAYTYLKEHGDVKEGIKQLINAKEYDNAVQEIGRSIHNMESWQFLEEIPIENLMKSDELIIQKIFYHFSKMEIDECKQLFNILDKSEDKNLKVIGHAFNMFFYYKEAMDYSELEYIDKSNLSDITKAVIYLNICALLMDKDGLKIINYAKKSEKIGEKYNVPYLSMFAKFVTASINEFSGNYQATIDIYKEIKEIILKNKYLSNFAFTYYLGIAGIYMKRYELSLAEEYIEKAKTGLKFNIPAMSGGIIYNMMEIKILRGELEEGRRIGNELINQYEWNKSFAKCNVLTAEMRYCIPMRQFEKKDLLEYKGIYEDELEKRNSFLSIDDQIVYARAIYILGEHEKAQKILDKALEYCRKYSIGTCLIEGLIIKVLILSESFDKNKREVFNLLREAIIGSSQNGYLRAYVIEGERLFKIINQMKNDKDVELTKKETDFIKKISDIIGVNSKGEGGILSEREIDVLCAVAEGYSNKEAAEKLNISLATVKSHMINIYSKLCVSNRVQAVEKARSMKIIK